MDIPNAASYAAPLEQGLGLGLGFANSRAQQLQAQQNLAERQRESQFAEELQGQAAQRQALEFRQTQDWRNGYTADLQKEVQARDEAARQEPVAGDGYGAPPPPESDEQLNRRVLSRWLPRAPIPVLEKLQPMLAAQDYRRAQLDALKNYRTGEIDVRNRNADTREGDLARKIQEGQEKNQLGTEKLDYYYNSLDARRTNWANMSDDRKQALKNAVDKIAEDSKVRLKGQDVGAVTQRMHALITSGINRPVDPKTGKSPGKYDAESAFNTAVGELQSERPVQAAPAAPEGTKPDVQKELEHLNAAITAQPARAAEFKKKFKERTGIDLP